LPFGRCISFFLIFLRFFFTKISRQFKWVLVGECLGCGCWCFAAWSSHKPGGVKKKVFISRSGATSSFYGLSKSKPIFANIFLCVWGQIQLGLSWFQVSQPRSFYVSRKKSFDLTAHEVELSARAAFTFDGLIKLKVFHGLVWGRAKNSKSFENLKSRKPSESRVTMTRQQCPGTITDSGSVTQKSN
jgi:hypothetical protein